MVQQQNVCKGAVSLNTGCLNCARCEEEILAALPPMREALKNARNKGDQFEIGRLEASVTLYELALRKMNNG
jgi:hypothetical protein